MLTLSILMLNPPPTPARAARLVADNDTLSTLRVIGCPGGGGGRGLWHGGRGGGIYAARVCATCVQCQGAGSLKTPLS